MDKFRDPEGISWVSEIAIINFGSPEKAFQTVEKMGVTAELDEARRQIWRNVKTSLVSKSKLQMQEVVSEYYQTFCYLYRIRGQSPTIEAAFICSSYFKAFSRPPVLFQLFVVWRPPP